MVGRSLGALLSGVLLLVACRGGADGNRPLETERPGAGGPPSPSEPSEPSEPTGENIGGAGEAALPEDCSREAFVDNLPIAEASAAVVTLLDGSSTLMVVGDSGHTGDYLLVDPTSGAVRERGKLPLGGYGDDLEGLAVRGDRIWALTSSGWLRAWKRTGPPSPGFELVAGPVAIGPATGDQAMSCDIRRANCGRNFEGLCLAPRPTPNQRGKAPSKECVGMAASKADGKLYCIVESREGNLTIDPARSISVSKSKALADCNISASGDGETLWVGANFFDFNRVWKIQGWKTPERAESVVVTELGMLGTGFCEGIAADGETLFRLSDTQGSPSLISKFRCSPSKQ